MARPWIIIVDLLQLISRPLLDMAVVDRGLALGLVIVVLVVLQLLTIAAEAAEIAAAMIVTMDEEIMDQHLQLLVDMLHLHLDMEIVAVVVIATPTAN